MKDPIHHRGKLSKKVIRDARQASESESETSVATLEVEERGEHQTKDRQPLRRDPHQGWH